jgi:2-polyprenyl-3-methyl-5-hydroxy-6-metoxy-1,4-benzoquinol methylase
LKPLLLQIDSEDFIRQSLNEEPLTRTYATTVATPEGYPLANKIRVVVCNDCGFAYSDTKDTAKDYIQYYSAWSKYEQEGALSEADYKRLQEVAQLVRNSEPNKTVRILDIGCASGGLLESLRDIGYMDLTGLDPSSVCVGIVKDKGINAYVGDFYGVRNMGRFDLILLTGVLEHLLHPQEFLSAVQRLLKPYGKVFIAVPDAHRYDTASPFQDFNLEHINHFTKEILTDWMERNGFQLVCDGNSLIAAPPDTKCAIAYGTYCKPPLRRSVALRDDIEAYIWISAAKWGIMRDRAHRALHNERFVIVWGAGQFAMKLLADPPWKSVVSYIVDSNEANIMRMIRVGSQKQLSIVLSPHGGRDSICAMPGVPILIASPLFSKEIKTEIQSMGLTNPIIELVD